MSTIPRPALFLGLAVVIPFAAGAWWAVTGQDPAMGLLPGGGSVLLRHYGLIILCFMSGALWGFATSASGARAALAYGLSVLPALWALFATAGPSPLPALLAGFIGLLPLDWLFQHWGLAPRWWLRLRLILSGSVGLCLIAGISA